MNRPSVVEFCLSNVSETARHQIIRQAAGGIVTIVPHRCLSRCGDCFASPFLVVDDDIRRGSDHDEILKRCLTCTPTE